MRRRLTAIVALCLLMAPSGAVGVFDGLPLDSVSEFAALAVLVAVLCLPGAGVRWPRWWTAAVVVVAIAVPAAKAALLFGGAHEGFAACYRPLPAEPSASCARSWANPLRLAGATRFDPLLRFHAYWDSARPPEGLSDSTWNLAMFNDQRFNFYPWSDGVPVRERLPFAATWTGSVADGGSLEVRYVGEAAVTVDGRRVDLGPAYAEPTHHRLVVPAGARRLRVDFRFDDGSLQPWKGTAPYAMFELRDAGGGWTRPAGPGAGARGLALAVDLLLGALLAALALPVLAALLPHAVVLAAALGAAMLARRAPGLLFAPPMLLALGLAWTARRRGLPVAAAFLGALGIAVVMYPVLDLHTVLLRSAGDDWLTYESQARAILDHASLWGGEDVFVYSAGFRYVLAGLRLLLGEAELWGFVLGRTLLLWGAVLVVVRFFPAPDPARPRSEAVVTAVVAVAAAAAVFDLLGGDVVSYAVVLPLSEWPTWALLPFALLLLFGCRARWAAVAGCALLGIAATLRVEQMPALALLLALALWRRRQAGARPRALMGCAAAAVAVVLLPGLHNLVYGGVFTVLPQTPRLSVNFPLPPSDLPRLRQDPEVRRTLASQVAGVLYLMPHGDEPAEPAVMRQVRSAQAVWLAAAAWALASRVRRRRWPPNVALLALPVAYLAPHLFVQVYVYYPRHIVAGCLAMSLSTIAVVADADATGAPVSFDAERVMSTRPSAIL